MRSRCRQTNGDADLGSRGYRIWAWLAVVIRRAIIFYVFLSARTNRQNVICPRSAS
ncbi:uncharacterized protein ASPGLDRAFT_40999 [Aspergillus glaucus CBS 516.65]|uniref:Uncharacterized protein n=1 Tax=Aspergillus glaucus CBS 516.65 TaxID=1160497 RepID=A0A1L9VYU8_ASPGL|nr:hypothetical protein ASPGLDRAFT_40999 [Aspergillus glaucus CBS 516.65]OJJ89075.1 hypothetical protein ASPGLDRAFT_40999 [Aspergillus glaucus CBS 516.65]